MQRVDKALVKAKNIGHRAAAHPRDAVGQRHAESVKNMVCRRLPLLKFWDLEIKQLPVMRMEVLRIWRKIILLN